MSMQTQPQFLPGRHLIGKADTEDIIFHLTQLSPNRRDVTGKREFKDPDVTSPKQVLWRIKKQARKLQATLVRNYR